MDEIINNHQIGPFEYVTVTSTTLYSKKELNNVLLSRLGDVKKKTYDLQNFPVVALSQDNLSLSIDKALLTEAATRVSQKDLRRAQVEGPLFMMQATKKAMMDYVTLNTITYNFNPTSGADGELSYVKISIMDNRFKTPRCLRSIIHNSNLSYTGLFSLDHSFHKNDIQDIVLKIENPKNNFLDGKVWGSATIEMSIVESDQAFTTDMLPTTGTYRIGFSFLTKHKRNPSHFDMGLKETSRSYLQEMAKKGLISDRTKSSVNQKLDFSKIAGSAVDSEEFNNRDDDFSDDMPRPSMSKSKVDFVSNFVSSVPPVSAVQRTTSRPLTATYRQTPPPRQVSIPSPQYPPNYSMPTPQPDEEVVESPARVLSPNNPFRHMVSSPPGSPSHRTPSPPSAPPMPKSILKGKGRATFSSPPAQPSHLSPVFVPPSSPVVSPTVLQNRQIVADSNLGSTFEPISLFSSAAHPHIVATTDVIPPHSKLFSTDEY
jgi:hypothetical protein